MYKLKFKNGLFYADITILHEGKEVKVIDVIIDTGASKTIILPDFLYEYDISFNDDDELVVMSGIGGAEASAFRKRIESISLGDIVLTNMFIDFGVIDPKDGVNGLIGNDFLKTGKVIIDTDGMTLSIK
ncbi:UNVERIFIED_CONTAM: putative aspartyl protease [Acetivibrio alkalicellulosi]